MVEELKLIAEILGNATDAALLGVGIYLLLDFLKIVAVCVAVVLGLGKIFKPTTIFGKSDDKSV